MTDSRLQDIETPCSEKTCSEVLKTGFVILDAETMPNALVRIVTLLNGWLVRMKNDEFDITYSAEQFSDPGILDDLDDGDFPDWDGDLCYCSQRCRDLADERELLALQAPPPTTIVDMDSVQKKGRYY